MTRFPVALAASLALGVAGAATAQPPIPAEPEADNREYVLDAVTNDFNRAWREVWAEGDNRFRMRVGSNNVTQWFLEEQLKFSTGLVEERLRFRFHHERLLRNSSERITGDTFEFEGRVFGDNYLSGYVTPTSTRAENAVGLVMQNRRAVNRYARVIVEFPHVVRNFTEGRKGAADSLDVVFADKPLRLGLDVRERVYRGVWFALEGEIVPEFTVTETDGETGELVRSEAVKATSLAGWVETSWPQTDPLPERSAVGLEAGYRKDERGEVHAASMTAAPALADPAFPVRRAGDDGALAAGGSVLMEFDRDLYWISADDSVAGWTSTRAYGKPYAWIVLDHRWSVRGVVRFERREIRHLNRQSMETIIENRYVAPAAGARLALGAKRRSTVELGWASLFRTRKEKTGAGSPVETDIDDHRIYAGFDYAFAADKVVRLIESFELDARDRGQYGIHDHGFVQLIFGF
jgi:hypothetical protein